MSSDQLHTLFDIYSSYHDLYWDEGPVVYSGYNHSGWRIIGSVVREDLFDSKTRSHLRALVSEQLYAKFLSKGISYLEVLKQAELLASLTIDLRDNIVSAESIEFEALEDRIRPTANSFLDLNEDVEYSAGRLLITSFDGARSTGHVMGAPFSYNVIGNMIELCTSFFNQLKATIDSELVFCGTQPGSMKFLFGLEHRTPSMFDVSEHADHLLHWAVKDCGQMFTTGIQSHLSTKSAEKSEGYRILAELYQQSTLQQTPEELADTIVLLRSSVVVGLNDILGRTKGEYATMTLGSCDARLLEAPKVNEQTLLAIDDGRKKALRNASGQAKTTLESAKLPETDEYGSFTIEVYHYNRETGRGWAYLVENNMQGPRIKLHVDSEDGSTHKPFTTSLDDAVSIRVDGTMYYSGDRVVRLEVS